MWRSLSTAHSFANGNRWRSWDTSVLLVWLRPRRSVWDNTRTKALITFVDIWTWQQKVGIRRWRHSVCSIDEVRVGIQSSGIQILKRAINFGKDIERSKRDYLQAGKSPTVKCLFQRRSLQNRGWSFVSVSKPADRWNDMGTESWNSTGSRFRSILILLSFMCYSSQQLLRLVMSEIMKKMALQSKIFLLLQWAWRPLNASEMYNPKLLPILFTEYIQFTGNI